MINVCPAALVEAAPGHVWRVLTEQYEAWSGAELVRAAPAGPAAPGQVIEFRARALGRAWPVVMRILEADAESPRLRVDVRLPLGIVNHETVTISPAGDGRSLVRFNWDFELPPGWRGGLVRLLLGRRLVAGPEESLAALKRAAEPA